MRDVVQEVILCPICGKAMHSRFSTPIQSRASIPSGAYAAASGMLTAMMLAAEAEHQNMLESAENDCREHFRTKHAWRLRLWKRTGWERLMNRRWFFFGQRFDFDQFDIRV